MQARAGNAIESAMSEKKPTSNATKAAIAGAAIGSAAIAAALLYANRRKAKEKSDNKAVPPSGEPPETD